jgi:hypothetical protein
MSKDLPPTVAALLAIHAERAKFDENTLLLVQSELAEDRKTVQSDRLTPIAMIPEGENKSESGSFVLPAGATLRLFNEMISYAIIQVWSLRVLSDTALPISVEGQNLQLGGTPNMLLGETWTPLEVWHQDPPAFRFYPEIVSPNRVSLHVRNTGPKDVRLSIQLLVRQKTDELFTRR